MYGLEEVLRHYFTLSREIGVDSAMLNGLLIVDINNYTYGEAAFIIRPWINVDFLSSFSGTLEQELNRHMS